MVSFATSTKPGKGRLCVYERGKAPKPGTPKSEGAERGFFVSKLSDGTYSDRPAEDWAQKIEDRATDTLIHAPNPCFVWSEKTRQRMAEYWPLSSFRFTYSRIQDDRIDALVHDVAGSIRYGVDAFRGNSRTMCSNFCFNYSSV